MTSTPRYLLDTNWIVDFLAGREPFRSRMRQLGLSSFGIGAATAAELYEGAFYSRDPKAAMTRLQAFLDEGVSIVPITHEVAMEIGRVRGRLRQDGNMIGDFDLSIGCTARLLGIPVCTENRRHFERIEGLQIISLR